MTKILLAVLLISIMLLTMCGCVPPLGEQTVILNNGKADYSQNDNVDDSDEGQTNSSRIIYVSGAVINDGYVEIPSICDYKTLFEIVGVNEFSAIPVGVDTLLNTNLNALNIEFVSNGEVCPSVNANGVLITSRMDIQGVEQRVVNILADYIELNGKITNREQLKAALGDYYDSNFYKFYIDRPDYA